MSNNKQFTRTLEQAQERLSIVKEQEKDFNKQVSNNHKQIKQLQIKNKKIAKKISSHMKYMNQLSEEIQSKIPKQEEYDWQEVKIVKNSIGVDYYLQDGTKLIEHGAYVRLFDQMQEFLESQLNKNPTTEVDKILEIDEAKHVEYWYNEFKVASKSLGEWIEKYCKLEKENEELKGKTVSKEYGWKDWRTISKGVSEPYIWLTKEQLDAMMRNVWNAAREESGKSIGRIETDEGDCGFYYNKKYLTFEDYKNTLPENKASNTGNEFEQARRNPIERDGNFKNSAPKEEELKDWEIIEYGYIQNNEGKPDQEYISKVLRKSDGVVFSIGDKVQGVEEILSIEKFDIEYALGNLMKVCFNEGGFYPIEKLPTPTEQANSDTLPQIDEDAFKNRCNVCGDDLVYIRGKYPNTDKRPTCPTCTTERLEQISEISNKDYGKAYQNKNQ